MNTKMIAVLAVAVLTLRAGFTVPKARSKGMELLSSKRWMMNLYKPVNFFSALLLVAMTLSACAGVEDRRDDAC